MRLVNKFYIAVGVALCVAPIFSSLQAQTVGQGARSLEQMQSMQRELAELRDMIERQNFTIRQMQRRLDRFEQGGAQGVPGGSAPVGVLPQSAVPGTAVPETQIPAQSESFPNPANSSVEPVDNSRPADSEAVAGSNQSSVGGDFYQPFDPSSNPGAAQQDVANEVESTPAQSNPSGASNVEERVITAPPAQASQREFPPVVDRSIGLPGAVSPNANVPAPVEDSSVADVINQTNDFETAPIDSADPASEPLSSEPTANSSLTLEPFNAPTPSVNAGNGGVVAIPPAPAPELSPTAPIENAPAEQTANVSIPDAAPAPTQTEADLYNQGFELLKQSQFKEASDTFNKQIELYPQGDLADDAHYWISEAMTVTGDTDLARKNLKAIVVDYPQSTRVPDAKLRLAYIEERKGNLIEARILLQEIVTNFPQSNAAIAAKNRLGSLQQ